jgi:hypothetical protein
MDITVEVGTKEEQAAIQKELETILGILDKKDNQIVVSQVIVAKDFNLSVNRILGISTYQSSKLVGDNLRQVEAKVINTKNGTVLMISPIIYSELYDPIIRSNIYFHEIVHCFNASKLPPEPSCRSAKNIYLRLLRLLIDEYIADIKSYKGTDVCWKDKSDLWNDSIVKRYSGYCALINDNLLSGKLTRMKTEFSNNHDIVQYLNDISPIIDDILISTIHAIALSDYYPDTCDISKILCSQFVNEDIVSLIEFIRNKFHSNDFTIIDGERMIINAIKIFGIELRDEGNDLKCRIT